MSAWRHISDCLPAWLRDAEFEPTSGAPRRDALNADRPGPGAAGVDRAIGLGNCWKKAGSAKPPAVGAGEVTRMETGRPTGALVRAARFSGQPASLHVKEVLAYRRMDRAQPTSVVPRSARSIRLYVIEGGGH